MPFDNAEVRCGSHLSSQRNCPIHAARVNGGDLQPLVPELWQLHLCAHTLRMKTISEWILCGEAAPVLCWERTLS